MKRNHTFHYISRHARKGERENIRHLIVMNDKEEITETLIKREEIEGRLKEHNINYLKKAHYSNVFNDRIYKRLRENSVRNKILNGTLQREECDNENVYKFLKLL